MNLQDIICDRHAIPLYLKEIRQLFIENNITLPSSKVLMICMHSLWTGKSLEQCYEYLRNSGFLDSSEYTPYWERRIKETSN